MELMLNLMNRIGENDAEHLSREKKSSNVKRTMDLYFTHTNMLVALGYFDDDLVWFSYSSLSDVFLSRRVFETMKHGWFYRKAPLDKALATAGMLERDLEYMCYAHIDSLEQRFPVFSGCISLPEPDENKSSFAGVDFAQVAAVCPERLRTAIKQIGTEDDIAVVLADDFKNLENLYDVGEAHSYRKQQEAKRICDKWRNAVCLKMSERAFVRTLYHDVLYHRYAKPLDDMQKIQT